MNNDLKKYLKERIVEEGPLTIAQYMNLSLYHPEFGYYRNYNPIGQQGDFTTSPEISQMFGEIIGLCFMELWQRMDQPPEVHLIEFGPGQGTLMQDFLRAVRPEFKNVIDLHFVDISPILKQEQRNRIDHPRVTWHDDIEAAFASCQKSPVFIIANEFFDALPIHQYIMTKNGWSERLVTYTVETDRFAFTTAVLNEETISGLPLPKTFNEGEIFEICYGARYITQTMSQHICRQGGVGLIIDYGRVKSLPGDTLQAVRQHAYHDILVDPGTADLTAHVDFEALKNIAKEQGALTMGPTNQGSFLSELGIDIRAAKLKLKATPEQEAEIDRALHRLTHPTLMGDLFKVMAVTAPQTPALCGFALCTPLTSSAA